MKKLKKSKSIPNSGQFVAVWVYRGVVWSGTFRWGTDGLERYCMSADGWKWSSKADLMDTALFYMQR